MTEAQETPAWFEGLGTGIEQFIADLAGNKGTKFVLISYVPEATMAQDVFVCTSGDDRDAARVTRVVSATLAQRALSEMDAKATLTRTENGDLHLNVSRKPAGEKAP